MNPLAGLTQELAERPGHAYMQSVGKKTRQSVPRPRQPTTSNPWDLHARQLEAIDLVAQGLTNDEIAERMGVARKTVEKHMAELTTKMSEREGQRVNRVRAAILWDRFIRSEQQ